MTKEIKLNECLLTKGTQGKPLFDINALEFIDHHLGFTKVNKAYTIQVISDDPDEKCETGEHIRKIYPNQTNQTNATITQTSEATVTDIENNTSIN